MQIDTGHDATYVFDRPDSHTYCDKLGMKLVIVIAGPKDNVIDPWV
jgi:hypothetical protein